MTDGPDSQIGRFARSRYGVFTRTMARRAGFSDWQIRQRLITGQWRAVSEEALMVAGVPESFEARIVVENVRDRAEKHRGTGER